MSPHHWRLSLIIPVSLVVCAIAILSAGSVARAQETPPVPGSLQYLPLVYGMPPANVVIAAAYIDSAISYEPDEAVLLWNTGMSAQPLAGWTLAAGARRASFPLTATIALEPGARLWCTANTDSFRHSFGEDATCAWESTDNGAVMLDDSLSFVNSGGAISLLDADNASVDMLLYGTSPLQPSEWIGPPATLYTRGLAGSAGQVWQRKLDPASGLPIDSDTAQDWIGDLGDAQWGRRVRQPGWGGWDHSSALWPYMGRQRASWAVAVGPEGLYAPLAEVLASATQSVDLSLYTFEHPSLAALMADTARRGVRVRLVLDGSPPGGISDLQKYCVTQIAGAGGDVRYLAVTEDAPNGYKQRYRFIHAKYGIIDGRRAFVGSENLTMDAMPEPTDEPVGGRRGFYLFTDAAGAILELQRLYAADWRPDVFFDLQPYEAGHPRYGAPPPDFVLPIFRTYEVAESPFAATVESAGDARYAVISAPENAVRVDAGIQALIDTAGAGDEIVLMQLYENKHFGETSSNPIADPNPRLEALIDAARRGARVRLLLDGYFDDADSLRSNRATVEYIRTLAAAEGLDIGARTGNPTAGGIHAKLVLLHIGDETWSAVGSLNGGETSMKLNREVVLMVEQRAIYDRLYSVFEHDWLLGE